MKVVKIAAAFAAVGLAACGGVTSPCTVAASSGDIHCSEYGGIAANNRRDLAECRVDRGDVGHHHRHRLSARRMLTIPAAPR